MPLFNQFALQHRLAKRFVDSSIAFHAKTQIFFAQDSSKQVWCLAEQVAGEKSLLPQQVVDGVVWGFRLQTMKLGNWKNIRVIGDKLFRSAQRILKRGQKENPKGDAIGVALCLLYFGERQWYLYNSGCVVAYHYHDHQLKKVSQHKVGNTTSKLSVLGLSKEPMIPIPQSGLYKSGDVFVLLSKELSGLVDLKEIETMIAVCLNNPKAFTVEHQTLIDRWSKKNKQPSLLYSMAVWIF
jgi:hypothetical protein